MNATSELVDRSALKFNQLSIIVLTIAGFIFDTPWLPAFVAAVLLAGSFSPRLAFFKLMYRYGAKPAGILKPILSDEPAAPHIFAQFLGGIVLMAGSLLLFRGDILFGWILAGLVVLLAFVNVVFGFCAGCFLHYQFAKLGIPGFKPAHE